MKTEKILLLMLALAVLAGCGNKNAESSAASREETAGSRTEIRTETKAGTESPASAGTVKETEAAGTETVPESETAVQPAFPKIIGTDNPEEGRSQVGPAAPGEEDFVLTVGGIGLKPGMNALLYTEKLLDGKPEIQKGASCLGGGFDISYSYAGGLTLYTTAKGDEQLIYDIYVTEQGFSLPRGGVIGSSSRADIIALYGEPDTALASTDRYSLPGTALLLSFSYKNGILEGVGLSDDSL